MINERVELLPDYKESLIQGKLRFKFYDLHTTVIDVDCYADGECKILWMHSSFDNPQIDRCLLSELYIVE